MRSGRRWFRIGRSSWLGRWCDSWRNFWRAGRVIPSRSKSRSFCLRCLVEKDMRLKTGTEWKILTMRSWSCGEARLSGNERDSQDFYFDLGKGSVKISFAVDLVDETTKGDWRARKKLWFLAFTPTFWFNEVTVDRESGWSVSQCCVLWRWDIKRVIARMERRDDACDSNERWCFFIDVTIYESQLLIPLELRGTWSM